MFRIFLLVLTTFTIARPLVFDACHQAGFCYTIQTTDAKSWMWLTDYEGRKFVRVYLYSGILDIPADRLTLKPRK